VVKKGKHQLVIAHSS